MGKCIGYVGGSGSDGVLLTADGLVGSGAGIGGGRGTAGAEVYFACRMLCRVLLHNTTSQLCAECALRDERER